MASLQCYLLNLALRYQLKRRRYTEAFDVAQARKALSREQKFKMPEDVAIEPFSSPGLTGEWVRFTGFGEPSSAAATILYLHGGGYFAGSAKLYRPFTTGLAAALKANLLCIDYRLAPEYPYPAAVDDGLAAYKWLLSNGTDPSRLLLMGDSAGGGLSAAVLLAARDAGLPMPAAAVLYSPMADLAVTGQSMTENDWRDSMFWARGVRLASENYLQGADPLNPLASPIYGDLHGFPPLLVFASTHEVFRDDAVRLVERVQTQHGNATLELHRTVPHVWPIFHNILPEGKAAIARTAVFARQHLQDRTQAA